MFRDVSLLFKPYFLLTFATFFSSLFKVFIVANVKIRFQNKNIVIIDSASNVPLLDIGLIPHIAEEKVRSLNVLFIFLISFNFYTFYNYFIKWIYMFHVVDNRSGVGVRLVA